MQALTENVVREAKERRAVWYSEKTRRKCFHALSGVQV